MITWKQNNYTDTKQKAIFILQNYKTPKQKQCVSQAWELTKDAIEKNFLDEMFEKVALNGVTSGKIKKRECSTAFEDTKEHVTSTINKLPLKILKYSMFTLVTLKAADKQKNVINVHVIWSAIIISTAIGMPQHQHQQKHQQQHQQQHINSHYSNNISNTNSNINNKSSTTTTEAAKAEPLMKKINEIVSVASNNYDNVVYGDNNIANIRANYLNNVNNKKIE
ncbi:hypothetical protein HELRODRAFT_170835 [Helobdella robusta]|uniref:Uncharacterized protein n=1 Tax=Helobdella robusta TaxID=6412 RepID=T1F3H8_HELRO|nr:hypothetical protein HELRODRAFT_170835 [Helobdella robusta]ESO06813.1 hypothetical protein HELRODRAFT_170835 [Helobdella robusta]